MLSTDSMGGVTVTEEQLHAMQQGDYILHARGGKLEKIPVEKIRLPRDPLGHVQRVCMAQAPDGTIYAAEHVYLHKSTDGGRTWEHLHRDPTTLHAWRLQFDQEGAMINVCPREQDYVDLDPKVLASRDEGRRWELRGRVKVPTTAYRSLGWHVTRLEDGTLLVPIMAREAEVTQDWNTVLSGANICYVCRSTDGGRTWPERSVLGEWCGEVSIAALPGGKLLAVIRYQRGSLPDDPPDLPERTGAAAFGITAPYKHVFLADSEDGGRTWTEPRQLTTVFGQCHGAGVGLSDDRVVVIHDHRYPRSLSTGRAMVSHDGGQSWEDEVYYLVHGLSAGFPATVSPDGEEMVTLTGSYDGEIAGWDRLTGQSDMMIIRWRLV